MKYGLVVIDSRAVNEDGEAPILHFCGYEENPSDFDVQDLYRELGETPEFGCMDIMDFIEIHDASPEIVTEYREGLLNGEITEVNTEDYGEDNINDTDTDTGSSNIG